MIEIREKNANENWQDIRNSFYKSLSSPLDGMWDELIHDQGQLWGIYDDKQIIGYCSKDEDSSLINFYLTEKYKQFKTELFKRVLYMLETRQAIVGTNNPDFLVASLDRSKKMAVHSYLFENEKDTAIQKPIEIEGLDLEQALDIDIPALINFCNKNIESDPNWLEGYIKRLVDRKEIYFLKKDGNIISTCEIRKSLTQPSIADIGTIVDSGFRNKGIGSWLIAKTKEMSLIQGNIPICSCEHTNIGSKKMIENAGFISKNIILKISF